ncbi:MAG: hypothetical protein COA37_17675 [Hoeflea sp.]|uniref:hypothetical protein n=1 Tax=Hoeflea sp. TaxID=1940281 RepID=UPI000C0D89F5|nr:hypothetical protein [Hoeflea sp.]PHR19260.1 MAG: hypothetical protein COA37_17675 [Hoeflea sp.]
MGYRLPLKEMASKNIYAVTIGFRRKIERNSGQSYNIASAAFLLINCITPVIGFGLIAAILGIATIKKGQFCDVVA